MTKSVRWGVLGAAKFAREHMARAIHAAEGAEFAALATSSPEKAELFQAFQPALTVYDNYDALLADDTVEVVYVPLPNHLHVEWSLRALEAGKHVLCEKPLAMHAEGFDPVIAKRDETGLLAAEAYMIVHHPQWQKAKALFEAGEIGELTLVDASFSYDNRTDPQNIRNRPETGGGSIPDIGVYTIGSVRFVTGQEPVSVQSRDVWYENDVDVYAHFTAQFDGFSYRSMTSMRLFPRQEMVFQGTKGLMRLTAPFNPTVFGQAELNLETSNGRQTWTWPGVNHYVRQVEAFCRSVRDGAPYPCPLEFSRGTQAMIDMFWQSEKARQK